MDTHKYICGYCHELYIPIRRYAQKDCSNSCRSKAYHRRKVKAANEKTIGKKKMKPFELPNNIQFKKKTSIEQVSLAGVTNAVLGSLFADWFKNLTQGEGNKPFTKNDMRIFLEKMDRYHLINNQPPVFGKKAYFDMYTNRVEYF